MSKPRATPPPPGKTVCAACKGTGKETHVMTVPQKVFRVDALPDRCSTCDGEGFVTASP